MELKPSMTEAPPPGTHGRADTALARHIFGCQTLPEGHYIRWDGLAKRWLRQFRGKAAAASWGSQTKLQSSTSTRPPWSWSAPSLVDCTRHQRLSYKVRMVVKGVVVESPDTRKLAEATKICLENREGGWRKVLQDVARSRAFASNWLMSSWKQRCKSSFSFWMLEALEGSRRSTRCECCRAVGRADADLKCTRQRCEALSERKNRAAWEDGCWGRQVLVATWFSQFASWCRQREG